jgi:hypothetical protein
MKKITLIMLLFTILSITANADEFSKTGSVGAQFLKIGVGARYHGMGEASVASVNDVYALYWNPAGLTNIESSQLAITHINYLTDINLNYIAYARMIEGVGVFGAAVTMLSMGDQEMTTIEEPDGTGDYYSASSWAFQVGYARDLTANFSLGGSFKIIGERIHREKASGFAFDFGTLLYTGFRSLRLGMNISNMGGEMKFDGPDLNVAYTPDPSNPNQDPFNSRMQVDAYDLPLTFRIGMAYDVEFGNNSTVVLSAEAKHPNDNLQKGSLGAEFNYRNQYFLRAGYKFNYEEEGLALGGGFNSRLTETTEMTLDYAWVDFGKLSSVHRFSACIHF